MTHKRKTASIFRPHYLALLIGSLGVTGNADAQIIADPNAPANQRATVLRAADGAPLVNIQTPSASGLSRNTYRQFDVGTQGIYLNNSSSNPWMANGGTATSILNEVNSTSPSLINGAVRVSGSAAQVIIANPNGITVNGGSFVNASRATLVTGAAQFASGALTGFDVRSGAINVLSGGLNTTATPLTDLFSRVLVLTGAVRGNAINVVTGLHTINHSNGNILNRDTRATAAGAVTIDTGQLGGLYANTISILATEAGLGVRNAGTWQATGGQISVSADGYLRNSGRIAADQLALATVSGDIDNSGAVQATRIAIISAGGNANLSGSGLSQSAAPRLEISAKGNLTLNSTPTSLVRVGSTGTGGQISLSAGGRLRLNAATLQAHGSVSLRSDGELSSNASTVRSSTREVLALSAGHMQWVSSTVSGNEVHLETGAPFRDTTSNLTINSGNVRGTAQTTLIASGNLALQRTGTSVGTSPTSPLSSGGNLHLQAGGTLDIEAGSALPATRHISLLANESIRLSGIGGATASSSSRTTLTAGGNLLIAGGRVTADGTRLTAGQNLTVESSRGSLTLNGLLAAGNSVADRLTLQAGNDINLHALSGDIHANAIQANARNVYLISNGITSLSNLMTQSGSNSISVASTIDASNDLTVASIAANPTVPPGTSSQQGNLVQVMASRLTAGGEARLVGNGMIVLGPVQQRTNGSDTLATTSVNAGSIRIDAGSLQTSGATLVANGNRSTTSRSGNTLLIARSGDLHLDERSGVRTQLSSTGDMAVHADRTLTLSNTTAISGGHVSLTSRSAAINASSAVLTAHGVLNIASGDTQNHSNADYQGGAVTVSNQLGPVRFNNSLISTRLSSSPGLGLFNGHLSIESAWGLETDTATVFRSANDITLVQGAGDFIVRPSGMVGGAVSLGQLSPGRHLTLAARSGDMILAGQSPTGSNPLRRVELNTSAGDINLIGNQVSLQGSRLTTGGNINLTATSGNLHIDGLRHDRTEAGFLNTYWEAAQLNGRDITARAAGHVEIATVEANAANNLTLLSGGNTTVSGNYTRWRIDNRGTGGWYEDEHLLAKSVLRGSNAVQLTAAGGSLALNAVDTTSANGNVMLQAAGSIRLEAAEESAVNQATFTHVSRNKFGRKKVYTTEVFNEDLTAVPLDIQARDIFIKAGTNLQTFGARLNASGNLQLEAGDAIQYYAVRSQEIREINTSRTSSFAGVKYDSSRSTNTRSLTTPLPSILQSQNDILSNSGGDQLLQGTRVSYGGTAAFNAGVGERARSDARIILEGVRSTLTQVQTRESNSVVWQRAVNQGSVSETLTLPSFNGPARPTFNAPGGLTVQLPANSDFKTQISALSSQPGLSYLGAVASRTDVNWQPVKLAFDQWNYSREGLTPNGAALLAVAVAWASGGTGAGLVGATEGSMAAATANAAFSALAAQASITLVNNKGNIAQTLSDLASSQTAKAALAAALTAGVLQNIGATQTMRDLAQQTGVSDKLTYNLINASGRALTTTAINGGDLESALRAAIVGGVVDTAHGQVASRIGSADLQYIAHKLAHALVGCAAGSAAGGHCRDGAIGGAVGEVVAELFKGRVPAYTASDTEWAAFDRQVSAYGRLVAGAVAAFTGGNAQTAITAAETAIDNNARLAFRLQAMQQSVSPQQLYINLRVTSLQNAVRESGGTTPPNMTNPGARVNYLESDVARLEAQLRTLNPNHPLIYSPPTTTLSPLPSTYVNFATAVDMNTVGGSSTTAFGFPRNANGYFRALLRTNPQMFSVENQRVILSGTAPVIDTQWVRYNPSHQSFIGQELVHHHWMQSNLAVAVPMSVHQSWNRAFHPYR